MGEVTYIDAIREAQHDLLAADERVFIYGQDVGHFGGAFKATQGLKNLFPERHFFPWSSVNSNERAYHFQVDPEKS